MTNSFLKTKAESYLNHLCLEIPTRRVGTAGNQAANAFLSKTFASFGFQVESQPFECIDWTQGGVSLSLNGEQFQVLVGPFSPGCRIHAPLAVVSKVEELALADIQGKILLLRGQIAREQLMPKNFPFYNPDEHQRIIHLLETKRPAAVLSATGRNPELAGAVYPFPLIEDGDFDIPSAYMTEEEGARLASHADELAALVIEAERRPSSGLNLVARRGPANRRVVVSAHMDAKEDTPGALDNAAGVVALLLLAELLKDYEGELGLELVPFNGEDHYSAAGEIAYLKANEGRLGEILLNINIDAAGYRQKKNVFSLYECPDELASLVREFLGENKSLAEGEPWYQGDHMVFAMNGVPALAITSESFMDIETQFAHTPKDRPELVDCGQLVGVATALHDLLIKLAKNRVS